MKTACVALFALVGMAAWAQIASMKQLMLDLIYPASNDILLFVNRGAPKSDAEWAGVRRSALTLAESGNLLTMPGRAPKDRQRLDTKTPERSRMSEPLLIGRRKRKISLPWPHSPNRWMRPAPLVTNSIGRMCFRVKEGRSK